MAYPYTYNNNDYNAGVEYNNNGYADLGNNGNNFQEQQFQRAQDIYKNNGYPPIDNRPLNNEKNLGEQPYQEGLQQVTAEPLGPNFGQPEIQQQYNNTQQQYNIQQQYNTQQQYNPNYQNYQNYDNYNSPMQAPLYNPQMQIPSTTYGHELPPVPSYNYHDQISKPDNFPSSSYNLNQTQPYSRSTFNTENAAYASNDPQPPNNYSNYSQSQNTTYPSNDPYPPKNYSPHINTTYTSNDPRPPKNYPNLNTSYTSNDPYPPKNYSPPLNTSNDPRPPKDYNPAPKKSFTSNDPRPPKNYSPPPNISSASNDPRPPKNYSPPPNISSSSNGPRPPKNYSPSQKTNSQDNYLPPSQPAIAAPTYVGGNKRDRVLQKSNKSDNRCCSCTICGCIQCTCTLIAVLIGVFFIIVGIGMFTYSKTLPSVCGSSCDPSQIPNPTNSTTSAIPGNATDTVNKAINSGSSECKFICQQAIYNVLYWGGIGCFCFGVLLIAIQVFKMLCRAGVGCFCC
ncbi:hypothetical protein C2G38_2041376 [Gigaspora rosea]|uniref:Uncharacterized protein n=1 Tax=Gigaspora rosea TaxID=44941 RepID=A0A397UZF3_9GLOM|nr:hypothetical protein C2G38_2041376 [Gigaspora rosea]CAG8680071.1 855_t:CDS:1 [Gigaspora rosea]